MTGVPSPVADGVAPLDTHNQAGSKYHILCDAALGSVLFAVSQVLRVLLAGLEPDYVRDLLPSMVLGGADVGLALSTLIAAGATALPGERSATGSAIVNSGRQVASALGVAVLVTILGPATGEVSGYTAGWVVGRCSRSAPPW